MCDLRDYLETSRRELVEEVFRRMEQALVPFSESLEAFLDQLFAAPLSRDWRERWHGFVREQLSQGFVVAPQSVAEMEAWIEAWAKQCGLWVEEKSSLSDQNAPRTLPAIAQRTNTDFTSSPTEQQNPRAVSAVQESPFHSRLDRALAKLDEIQLTLAALASKLDLAKAEETVEVEEDVDTIEGIIWEYNDELENAYEAWLRLDLSSDLLSKVYELRTPLSFGLPLFADDDQYRRYRK